MNPSTTITARLLTKRRLIGTLNINNGHFVQRTCSPLLKTVGVGVKRTIITAAKLEAQPTMAKPPPPSPPPKDDETKPQNENSGFKRFSQFDITGRVFIVTGGAQGLGLEMAEALAEAGAKGKL